MDSTPVASTTTSNPNGWSSFSLSHWGLGSFLGAGKKLERPDGDGYSPVKFDVYVCSFEILGDVHFDTLVGSNNHLARAVQFQELCQHQAVPIVVSFWCGPRYAGCPSPRRARTQKQNYNGKPMRRHPVVRKQRILTLTPNLWLDHVHAVNGASEGFGCKEKRNGGFADTATTECLFT